MKKFQIGRFAVDEPVTAFVETGEIAETGKAGNIGARLLRRFRVIFDYSRRRMILELNSNAAEPEEFDMSGAGLVSEGPDFRPIKAAGIRPGSPAAEAGLEPEDVITAVDGETAELSVRRLKQLFRKEGRQYVLLVKRGEHTLRLKLRTRRMV